jgi:hypothetical protein
MIESLTHIIATIPHQPALQALQRIVPPVIQKITAILAIKVVFDRSLCNYER